MKKLLFKLIKKNLKLFLTMSLLGALGIAIVVGLMGSYEALSSKIYNYINDYNLEDIKIDVDLANKNTLNIDELKEVDGVLYIEQRISADLTFSKSEKTHSARFVTYQSDSFVKKDILESKEKALGYLNISVADYYSNVVSVSDKIILNYQGRSIACNVYQIVKSPETIGVKKNKWIPTSSSDFGFFYIEESELINYNLTNVYNQIIVKTSKDSQEVSNKLEEVSNTTFNNTELFKDSSLAEKISYNLDPLKNLAYIVPIVFFIVSLVINVLFMFQIIGHFKKNIGVLMMLGYDKKEIYKLFLILSFIISVSEIILGLLIGYPLECLSYSKFISAFDFSYTMPAVYFKSTIISSLIVLVITMFAGFYDTFKIIHYLTPIEAVRPNNFSKGKEIKIHLKSPRLKVELSRLLREYKSYIVSILSIVSSLAIIFAGFSFYHSKTVLISDTFEKRIKYDCMAYIRYDADVSEIKDVEGVTEYERESYLITDISYNGVSESTLIEGITPNTSMMFALDCNHNQKAISDTGITLDSTLAKNLGAQVGSLVNVSGKDYVVSDISYQSFLHTSYLNINDIEEPTGYLLLIKSSNKEALTNYLAKQSFVQSYSFTSTLKKSITNTMHNSDVGIYIVIGISVLMGLLIIYNLNLLSFNKNKRSYALKMSIGYYLKDIIFELILEDISKIILSLSFGFLIGRFFAKNTLERMSSSYMTFFYTDSINVYLYSAILIILFMLISRVFSYFKIRNMNISFEIKDKE